MLKLFLLIGSINMAIAVGLGAFGAHGLQPKLTEKMFNIYQTGVQYHMIHAVAIILVAIISDRLGDPTILSWAGWSFVLGVIFFSGSLYVLSISGVKILGAITPIGGILFIVGWMLLAFSAAKSF
ncbi:hypothetical protein BKP45_03815 [Anaerobacillus alkalidiazotrophicus]|uniref:DUF423 domain-containing protein n=1 Tax=Anaerobacillus alkalidiazotrophicus TaxID=472963 RepID=A0A1S2MAN4_9BACI|nr:DUF423 domain-containing protein [Anaerobacillus alkalidiazotrophicus]OIJ21832.1 hypothetical protein BKP45_03815 [Anaerobacillus alkalidiazotrophicus]